MSFTYIKKGYSLTATSTRAGSKSFHPAESLFLPVCHGETFVYHDRAGE